MVLSENFNSGLFRVLLGLLENSQWAIVSTISRELWKLRNVLTKFSVRTPGPVH